MPAWFEDDPTERLVVFGELKHDGIEAGRYVVEASRAVRSWGHALLSAPSESLSYALTGTENHCESREVLHRWIDDGDVDVARSAAFVQARDEWFDLTNRRRHTERSKASRSERRKEPAVTGRNLREASDALLVGHLMHGFVIGR